MATMKEYGLIFEDKSVKIAEVSVYEERYSLFCSVKVWNDLENELHSFLDKNNYKPIAIIPDTALHGRAFSGTIIRDATQSEKEEYLTNYYDNYMEED